MTRLGKLVALLCLAALAACSTPGPPLPLAQHVDLARYSGRWYVIANIPYFAERGQVGSSFDVSFPNGRVRDIYTARADFSAAPSHFVMGGYVVAGSDGAKWRESPFWPLYFSYLILDVDPDYQTALVGYPGRQYGWVFSRSPDMDAATYARMMNKFAALGYDTTLFRRVPQHPEQLGRPGFQ